MKTIRIDDKTAHRLRMYVAEEYLGKVHGNIGTTAAEAINHFIDEKERIVQNSSWCHELIN